MASPVEIEYDTTYLKVKSKRNGTHPISGYAVDKI